MKSNDESYARRVHVYQSRIGPCSRREAIAALVTGIRSMVEEMPREQLELLTVGVLSEIMCADCAGRGVVDVAHLMEVMQVAGVGVVVKRNRRDDHGQEH